MKVRTLIRFLQEPFVETLNLKNVANIFAKYNKLLFFGSGVKCAYSSIRYEHEKKFYLIFFSVASFSESARIAKFDKIDTMQFLKKNSQNTLPYSIFF